MTDGLNGHDGDEVEATPVSLTRAEQGDAERDLGVVRMRRLVEAPIEVSFPLAPGDRALVAPGSPSFQGRRSSSACATRA